MILTTQLPLTKGDHYVNRYAVTTDENVLVRHDTLDMHELNEARYWLGERDMKGLNVLHVGAGVGCFMGLAIQRGAAHVLAVEPDQSRHKVLQINEDRMPSTRAKALRAAMGSYLGRVSMTWKVDGHVTTQHKIPLMPLPNLMYTRPNVIILTVQGNEVEGWTSRSLGYDVRTVLIKTDRAHATSEGHLDFLESRMPGMRRVSDAHRFNWSPAVWYEWRRD